MIERLKGVCVAKSATTAIIDVQGIGYGVEMTETGLMRLVIEGDPVVIYTHTHVREDQLKLFGFTRVEERQMFSLFLGIDGVGPKLALAILGHLDLASIVGASDRDDPSSFEDVPGIGARLSKKILLELKPKLEKLQSAGLIAAARAQQADLQLIPQRAGAVGLDKVMVNDLRSALENFGYKEKELMALLKRYERKPPARDMASLVRLALKELTSGKPPPLEEVF